MIRALRVALQRARTRRRARAWAAYRTASLEQRSS